MANQEACELWIEQQIETGLEEGKTPYFIGNELSGWIAKLFEVRISPHTLQTRAYRQQQDVNSFELKESKPPEIVEDTTPEIIKDRQPQGGGKREGAGRKQSQTTIWKNVEKKLSELIKSMMGRCETPADIPDELKRKIDIHIDFLNLINKDLQGG
jgi:hypothetical protein